MPKRQGREAVLHSTDKVHSTPVTFFEPPQDSDECCPITSEPIATPALEGYESESVFKEQPELSGVQLECGHCFNAMALLYHWMHNHMLCPLCKQGSPVQLAANNFSGAWAASWAKIARQRTKQDALAGMREDENNVVQMTLNSYIAEIVLDVTPGHSAAPLPPLQVASEVSSVIYFYIQHEEDIIPTHHVMMPMRLSTGQDDFVSLFSSMRALNRAMASYRPSHIRICTFAVQVGGGVAVLAHSPRLAYGSLTHTRMLCFNNPTTGATYNIFCTPSGIRAISFKLPPDVAMALVV